MSDEPILSCRGLKKTYVQGKVEVPVLLGVDLDIARGEFVWPAQLVFKGGCGVHP